MTEQRNLRFGVVLLGLVALVGSGAACAGPEPSQPGGVEAPIFEVDPMWPKPLPNHWLLGSAIGVSVDGQDHVWIVHRGGSTLNARTEMSAATDPPPGVGSLLATLSKNSLILSSENIHITLSTAKYS